MPRHILMEAHAQMPASCRGRYRRLAIIELEDGFDGRPAMISERARGVARIVRSWERLSVGKTERCAYRVALAEAEALLASLNA